MPARRNLGGFVIAATLVVCCPLRSASAECIEGPPVWGSKELVASVKGVSIEVSTTIPNCPDVLQSASFTVRNTTSDVVTVFFEPEFTSVSGLVKKYAGATLEAHGRLNPGGTGSILGPWTPFRDEAGISPNPSFFIGQVMLRRVRVCPEDRTPRDPSTYKGPCDGQTIVAQDLPALKLKVPNPAGAATGPEDLQEWVRTNFRKIVGRAPGEVAVKDYADLLKSHAANLQAYKDYLLNTVFPSISK